MVAPAFSKHNKFFEIKCCKLGDVGRIGLEDGSADSLEQRLEAIRYDKSGLCREHLGRISVISTRAKKNQVGQFISASLGIS